MMVPSPESSSHSRRNKHRKLNHDGVDKSRPNEVKASPVVEKVQPNQDKVSLDIQKVQPNEDKVSPIVEKVRPNVLESSPNPNIEISHSVCSSSDSKNCAINSKSGDESDCSIVTDFASNYSQECVEKMGQILDKSKDEKFLSEAVQCVSDFSQKHEITENQFSKNWLIKDVWMNS